MSLALPRANWPLREALAKSVALTLSGAQRRFLALHAQPEPPWKWVWLWGSTIIRASAPSGDTVTLSAAEFDELVRLRFVRRSGQFGAVITDTGRASVTF